MSHQVDTIGVEAQQWIRAEELFVRLENDGRYVVERRVENDCAHAVSAAAAVSEEFVLHELRAVRLLVEEWKELVPCHARLPRRAVELLLTSLVRVRDDAVQQILVDAMTAATTVSRDEGRPGAGMRRCTARANGGQHTGHEAPIHQGNGQRPSIAAMQPALQEWIVTALADPRARRAREMLAVAAARLFPREIAQRVLVSILSEQPEDAVP